MEILFAVQEEIRKHHKTRTFGLKIQELALLDKNSVIFSHLRLETKAVLGIFPFYHDIEKRNSNLRRVP